MKKVFPPTCWAGLLAAIFIPAATLRADFVYDMPQELVATGDFDGDGNSDLVIVDKSTGRVRIGYRLSAEFFNWTEWRDSGVKSVSGVAVGKLVSEKRDSIAVTSMDKSQVGMLDAPDPKVNTDPVAVPNTALGPITIAAIDIGGAGNTPLADLCVASLYNNDPDNRLTLFRSEGKAFTQLAELPMTGAGSHANRVSLKKGGPEYVAMVSSGPAGNSLSVQTFGNGKPEEILSIGGLPAGVDYVAGNFRGTALTDFVFFNPGESNLLVSTLEEAGGKFKASPPKPLPLAKPLNRLVTVNGDKKSRLLAVFDALEPAELLDFDAVNPPVSVQKLAGIGTEKRFLSAAVALPDAVILLSYYATNQQAAGKSVESYQLHILKNGSFTTGLGGQLPDLLDRDGSTVPEIHKRIVASLREKSPAEMKPYTNTIPGSEVEYQMVPIPAGEFTMGSPEAEKERKPDEGPQHRVKIAPFWMGKYEVTWDQYLIFQYVDDELKLREAHPTDTNVNAISDAVTRPSKPYPDMSFGMGRKAGLPVISMTQHAANKYCHWLSAKTGHFYRLPTEAEWEYACRAGTATTFYFGDDVSKLKDHAWFFDNSDSSYRKVGKKPPNPWGLYDMVGNVSEWVLDQYDPDYYQTFNATGATADAWNRATKPYPHSVRGGSWDDDAPALRSASRGKSDRAWKATYPQLPKSIWHLSDGDNGCPKVGFRIVRPLTVPSAEELAKYWTSTVEKD